MTPRHVTVGDITIGNDVPLVFIVGPNTLEIASARAGDECRAGRDRWQAQDSADLQDLVRQGEPLLASRRARDRDECWIADPRRSARNERLAGADRHPCTRAVRAGGGSRRHSADPGLPLPPDRFVAGSRANRQAGQHQEGPVSRTLGHQARRRQDRLDRQRSDLVVRARRQLWLQHPDRRHARLCR